MSDKKLDDLLIEPSGFAWVHIYKQLESVEYALRFHTQTAVAEALKMSRPCLMQGLKRARSEYKKNGAFSSFYSGQTKEKTKLKNEVISEEVKPHRMDTTEELPPLPGALPEPKKLNFNGDD